MTIKDGFKFGIGLFLAQLTVGAIGLAVFLLTGAGIATVAALLTGN